MPEAHDLSKMFAEIVEDERVGISKSRKVSQDEIRRMLKERQRKPKAKDDVRLPLGEALLKEGLITNEELQEALRTQAQRGGKIGSILVEMGAISDDDLLRFLGRQHGLQSTSLLNIEISESLMSLLPSRVILKHRVLPLKVEGRTLSLAMVTPNDFAAVHEVEFITGKRVTPVIIPSYQMDLALKYIGEKGGRLFSSADIHEALKGGSLPIKELLGQLVSDNASDMLISAGVPPCLKEAGNLKYSDIPPLTAEQCVAYAKLLMTEGQWEEFLRRKEIDFGIDVDHLGRFRVNAYRQKNSVSLAIRRISEKILSFEALGLPPWMADFALKSQGLILVTAPAGHGKTTTVASMIDVINRNRKCNIITLEDPIEYIHQPCKSNINQREVGADTDSFSEGLRRLFRQSPDVILIGELRDRESFESALHAAVTGHLVLATLNSSNATSAIDAVIHSCPGALQQQVRQQLADSLLLIFSQRLLPRADGQGLAIAYEKLINSFRVKNLIREGKLHQIRTQIQTESDDFSSIDVALLRLIREGKVGIKQAMIFADNPDFIEMNLGKAGDRPRGSRQI
ncbi:MAG: PilT/PilU family type 4a pilus ATPase [Acidobacteriota bacterium]